VESLHWSPEHTSFVMSVFQYCPAPTMTSRAPLQSLNQGANASFQAKSLKPTAFDIACTPKAGDHEPGSLKVNDPSLQKSTPVLLLDNFQPTCFVEFPECRLGNSVSALMELRNPAMLNVEVKLTGLPTDGSISVLVDDTPQNST
jgi:hypothetical protein